MNQNHQMSLLGAALELGNSGLYTFPCFGIRDGVCGCGSQHLDNPGLKGKHPAIIGWQTKSSRDHLALRQLFDTDRTLNLAIDCQRSGLAVIDVDPRSGGDESLDRLISEFGDLLLSETVGTLTGVYGETRGRHFYFKMPDGYRLPANLQKYGFPGIDFKTNGYVIAPPSKHASGFAYEWVTGRGIESGEIRNFPQALLQLLKSRPASNQMRGITHTEKVPSMGNSKYGNQALQNECALVAASSEGTRNSTLFQAGLKIGSLISGGELNKNDAVTQLVNAALASGLDLREVEQTLLRPGGAIELGMLNPRFSGDLEPELISWALKHDLPRSQGESRVLQLPEILSKLNRVDWDEAFSGTPEEEWLVPGIFCAGRSHAVYADAGVGKTLLMHDICAGLASGRRVLGLPATSPIRVLYIDHENSIHGDVVPHLREMGYSPEELANLIYLSFPEMAPLDSHTGGVQLEAALDSFEPSLVVLDTVSRTVSGDENSNDTWLQFYNFAGKSIKKRGIAYVRLDHIGKNSGNGMRGGSAKKGDVDLVWFLKRRGESLNFSLTCEKSRVPIPQHSFGIMRVLSPLRHVLQGNESVMDWEDFIARSEKFDYSCALLKNEIAENGFLVGQRASWDKYKSTLQSRGVSRSIHYSAHKFVSAGASPTFSDVNDDE